MYILKVSEDENILAPRLSGSTDRAVPVLALPDNTPSAAAAKPGVQIIAQFDLAAPGIQRVSVLFPKWLKTWDTKCLHICRDLCISLNEYLLIIYFRFSVFSRVSLARCPSGAFH